MGIFKKKENVTLDQFSYLIVCEIMNTNIAGIKGDLDKEIKNTINSITMLSSLILEQFYVMDYLNNKNNKDKEQIGHDVGKSFAGAFIYWNEKNGVSRELIDENMEIMMQFNDDMFSSPDLNDSTKPLDELVYIYTNKRIFNELQIDSLNNIELEGMIAAYTKRVLKQLAPILDNLLKKYNITYQ